MDPPEDAEAGYDPRLTDEYVREVSGGSVTLLGVVHDHPSSIHRVQQLVSEIDPEILALELPPMSVPLFEQYAEADRTPPVFGGEMSAAIQTASSNTVVGIDRPTVGFFRHLARNLLEARPSLRTTRKLLSNVGSVTKHAVVCRLAATVAARTPVRLEVDTPVPHDVDWHDTPEEQARDEQTQVQRSRAFMNVFRTAAPSRASRLEDESREAYMASQLSKRQTDGDVVAIVGIDHLDRLADRLSAAEEE